MTTNTSTKTNIDADSFIDITSDTCPMTFVKTKLRLEKMESGQILEVILNEGEPLKNVPLSAEELGHAVLHISDADENGIHRLFIKKS